MHNRTQAVYAAVVSLPQTHAQALADHLGQSAADIDAALSELRDVGLIERSQIADGQWRAVAPTLAIGRRIADREREIALRLERLTADRDLMTALNDVYRQGQLDPHSVLRLADRDEVLSHLGELVEGATHEVASFVTSIPTREALAQAHDLDAYLVGRGVRLRGIYLDTFRRDRDGRRMLLSSREVGGEVRTRATLPTRLIIVDREHAVIAAEADDPGRGALLMSHPAAVQLFVDLFERYWQEAVAFPDEASGYAPPAVTINHMEQHILSMLAAGNKDESIARTTGQSVRTVRRVISTLSERVGARSRFDLALHAAARGWVSVHPRER